VAARRGVSRARSTVITAIARCDRPVTGGRDLRLTTEAHQSKGIDPMASLGKMIKDLARSPRGQQVIHQVKEQAQKPENRRRLEELRKRYMKR
jgi:hypothetical protein